MRRWFALGLLALWLGLPVSAGAQSKISLKSVDVQFWPEFDQPSMLVIYDIALADSTSLPAEVVLRIPKAANLIAVASNTPGGGLINAGFDGPTPSGDWQSITIKVETQATYHLEYYQPLTRSGATRRFEYRWPGDDPVEAFSVYLRAPVDTTGMATDPPLTPAQPNDDILAYQGNFGALPAGESFSLSISYEKSSDTLASPPQGLQPSAPVDQNTSGRVMFSNYLPYILGALAIVVSLGGMLYFWRSGGPRASRERRGRVLVPDEQQDIEVYCHQCGARARPGDRFCRICGSRLRREA
jgi:hypothetical protein